MIGANIQRIRKKMGMNQLEFAKLLYIDQSSLSRYENGRYVPGVDVLVKVAKLADINLQDLLDEEDLML